MQIHTFGQQMSLSQSFRDQIEQRFRTALDRFGQRPGTLQLKLRDDNGPKGGNDKICLACLRLTGMPQLIVRARGSDWLATLDQLATRLANRLHRQLSRQQQLAPLVSGE